MELTPNRLRKTRPTRHPVAVALAALLLGAGYVTPKAALAAESADVPSPVTTVSAEEINSMSVQFVDDILKTMFEQGKVSLNIRGRAEIADQEGKQTSQAYTERTRLGFTTGEYNGLQVHIDVEDIRAADEDLYNAAGTNDQPNKTSIADIQDTELNQLYANFVCPTTGANLRVGRQRIILDDERFVGNVGWRQNEQTYDAVLISHNCTDQLSAAYSYIWQINRIFGPDADLDLDSDSHVLHVTYTDETLGTITGFGYLLSVDGLPAAPSLSSDTWGIRYEATRDLDGEDGPKLNYVLSYATQSDAGDNPTSYDADYFLADVKYIRDGWYAGGGYELLGSDGGTASFQTPLATGHKFNGWADVFLATPADGLEDIYIYLGGDLPEGCKGKVAYHWFDPDEGGADYGEEIDAMVSKQLSANAEVLAKYAYYNGSDTFPDIVRFWLQLTLNY